MASYFIDEEFIANYPNGFEDEFGNKILCSEVLKNVKVTFSKNCKNNTAVIATGAKIHDSTILFSSHDASFKIGHHKDLKTTFRAYIRLGFESNIHIGNNTTTTARAILVTSEQASIYIGDDCMIASENQIRAEDSHAIYDVEDGRRLNFSKDIIIGNHVWLAFGACVLSGTHIKDGCVVGFKSLVKGNFPNNCIIVGMPAKIVRKNIVWERPDVYVNKEPPIKIAKPEQRTKYWKKTEDDSIFNESTSKKIMSRNFLLSKIKGLFK